MAAARFTRCSEGMRFILDNFNFRAKDFWQGYKLYCFAHYSHCETSKDHFRLSKMGRAMCELQNVRDVQWGAQFDGAIREVWPMMEEYVQVRHGNDCTDLKALMEEFEDVQQLSTFENGRTLLQIIQDDANGSERLYRQFLVVQLDTDIFQRVRARLNRAQVNLQNPWPRRILNRRCRR